MPLLRSVTRDFMSFSTDFAPTEQNRAKSKIGSQMASLFAKTGKKSRKI